VIAVVVYLKYEYYFYSRREEINKTYNSHDYLLPQLHGTSEYELIFNAFQSWFSWIEKMNF